MNSLGNLWTKSTYLGLPVKQLLANGKFHPQLFQIRSKESDLSIILWQSVLRETVGLRWPLGEQNDHKFKIKINISKNALVLANAVSWFLLGNEEHILGFADCLGVLVSLLFCESDERLSQFYHQILRWLFLKMKYDSERRLCTNVSQEDVESVITFSFSENQRPEITSCHTKLKGTSLLKRDRI